MKRISLISFIAAGTVGLSCSIAAETEHKPNDNIFAAKAAEGGLTEVQLGQIAEQNGGSQDVKDFGAKMVTDHGKANDNLKAVAEKDSLSIPDKPNADQQALIDKLSKETGKAFDRAYIHAMVRAHIADKALFTREAASGGNPDLRQFAGDTLPVIKEHLSMIEDIASGNSTHQMSAAAESKSGPGPGGTANSGAGSPEITGGSTMESAPGSSIPNIGSSSESKSGPGPGGNASSNTPAPVAPQ